MRLTRSNRLGGILIVWMWLLTSCHYPIPQVENETEANPVCDSVRYLLERHYTLNSNFEVTADSLLLHQLPLLDSLTVYQGERLVVAEFMVQPADSVDSIWVKVARDQETIGWIHERELLQRVVPVDSVSQFIHVFSHTHMVPFLVVLALSGVGYLYRAVRKQKLQLVWFNDIDSVFPVLLSWLMATAATLYASIQHFVPDTWELFYYNPSLDPLELPFVLSLFVCNVWAIILVGLATLDDLFRQARTEAALFYLLGLASSCILLYLFFTFSTYYYIGYPCLLVYTVWAFRRLKETTCYRYGCGNCGTKMKTKGICPHCGAMNE